MAVQRNGTRTYNKPALSYTDQLNRLKTRGLIIENEDKALHLLENVSYYRLSAYWYPFLKNPKAAHLFKPKASFNKAFKLYCFDRELRLLLLREIEKVEVALRAKIVHEMSVSNGPFWFRNQALFSSSTAWQTTMNNLSKEQRRSDTDFIKAFLNNYSDPYAPSWMIYEISDFGTLSHTYKNLIPGRKKRAIAGYFGLDDSTLQSWLHSINYVRNACAHHTRIWNKVMRISPQIPTNPTNDFITIHSLPNSRQPNRSHPINNRIYFVICMLIYLLNIINPNHSFKQRLFELLKKYPSVDKKALGFPEGWETEPIWMINKSRWKRLIGKFWNKN